MPAVAPQHLRTRPSRSETLRHAVVLRRSTVLTAGTAVAVPGTLGGLGVDAAHASPPVVSASPTSTAPSVVTLPSAPTTKPVLRYGATGSAVSMLQRRLGSIAVDGSFGPNTLAAVRSFQTRNGLTVDGIVGPNTWSALSRAQSTAPSTPESGDSSPTCSTQVLRYGSSGEAVSVLQGRVSVSRDGAFGPATLSAVKSFQKKEGLSVDGIVGPRTWAALGGYPCGSDAETPAPDPAPEEPTIPPTTGTADGERVLAIAKKYLGINYVYGAESPSEGFDCSGLTQYVYRQVGIELPRTSKAQSQFRSGVDLDSLQVGDLVFFHSPIRHVAIYAGNGLILDASQPGTQISIHKMWVPPVKAIRLV